MMNKYLILIAGSPATGKSSVEKLIKDLFDNTLTITPDEFKEMYADSVGFSNLDEKDNLEKRVWDTYYSVLKQYMEAGKQIIISEYPFSMKQYGNLKKYSEKYNYNVITIRLVAEFETLWDRRYKRDRDPSRHLSHLVTSYHYGDKLYDRELADNHISKEDFKRIIEDRKYNEFELGKLFEVNTTDFNKVDFESLEEFLINNVEV